MPYLDSPVRGHATLEGALEGILKKLDGLDELDGYMRNHLTSKMTKGFDEVNNELVKVSNLLQDHKKASRHEVESG